VYWSGFITGSCSWYLLFQQQFFCYCPWTRYVLSWIS